jgi:hypothetical protein
MDTACIGIESALQLPSGMDSPNSVSNTIFVTSPAATIFGLFFTKSLFETKTNAAGSFSNA